MCSVTGCVEGYSVGQALSRAEGWGKVKRVTAESAEHASGKPKEDENSERLIRSRSRKKANTVGGVRKGESCTS